MSEGEEAGIVKTLTRLHALGSCQVISLEIGSLQELRSSCGVLEKKKTV
jgi:hypothetical protein